MTTVTHSTDDLYSTDGTELFVQKWAPEGDPKGYVVIIHGYLEHSGRYAEVAEYIAKACQVVVSVFDVRGHGKSMGNRASIGTWTDYHEDLNWIFGKFTVVGKPKFVLGHSNGGLIVLSYLRDHVNADWTGALISSPFLEPAEALGKGSTMASKVLGFLFPNRF